jgi:Holliday junction resolvase RusA-like endonuclease
MNFTINTVPPSLNSMYRQFKGRIILSESARNFKILVKKQIPQMVIENLELNHDYYEVKIEFVMPNLYRKKDGKISRKSGDLDNMCKSLIDVIFTQAKMDDSKITSLLVKKTYGESEKTNISICGHFFNMPRV